jgi:ABC-type transport system involved in cytochrome bd biosynthesis fused ATPase/permease subunit
MITRYGTPSSRHSLHPWLIPWMVGWILSLATSALDNETESAVMEAIDALQGKKTLIIIAHRLSTIKNCDKVYEIKDKKAVLADSSIRGN